MNPNNNLPDGYQSMNSALVNALADGKNRAILARLCSQYQQEYEVRDRVVQAQRLHLALSSFLGASSTANAISHHQQQQQHLQQIQHTDFPPKLSRFIGHNASNQVSQSDSTSDGTDTLSPHQHQLRLEVAASTGFKISTRRMRKMNERQEFVAFIKVLFQYLKDNQDFKRLSQAKAIVAECTQRNRIGVAGYTELKQSTERRLRPVIGEVYWSQAKDYLRDYCRRRNIQKNVK
jgi:hypothetical protein